MLAYFRNAQDLSDALFSSFKDDSVFYEKPDTLRRPMIFYFGHNACVFANKMMFAGLIDKPLNDLYQKMFETGVDEMPWDDMDDMQDPDYPWPTVSETMAWRKQVRDCVEEKIGLMPDASPDKPATSESPFWAVWMGIEHERIHLETSSVLVRQMPVDAVVRPDGWNYAPSRATSPEAAPRNCLVDVKAGTAVLGKPVDFPTFGWDNEYGRRDVDVPAFRGSKYLVTNAEFLPFVLDGGYETKKWWITQSGDDEGWKWLQRRGAKKPIWWVATSHPELAKYRGTRPGSEPTHQCLNDDGTAVAGKGPHFRLRVMFDIIDMPWDWPVEVNYLEAAAFLNWKSAKDGVAYRVPTEAEYNLMRAMPSPYDHKVRGHADVAAQCEIMMRDKGPGNINLRYGSASPVNMFDPSPAGFYDIQGNVSEHVCDHFNVFDGFKIHYLYDDYSTPLMDGWHNLLMGGAWVSSGSFASSFARNCFRRHFYQQSGFRYVTSDRIAAEEYPGQSGGVKNMWEGIGDLSEDLDTGYTPASHLVAPALGKPAGCDYAAAVTTVCAEAATPSCNGAAGGAGGGDSGLAGTLLHLGCGVGSTTFQLAHKFDEVLGVDADKLLIRSARVLLHHTELHYERLTEGMLRKTEVAHVPADAHRERVQFFVGDAADLAADVTSAGPFNVVFVDGLLDRMRNPRALVCRLAELVKPGGAVVIASANDWTSRKAPKGAWLGGFEMGGEVMDTLTMLGHTLGSAFKRESVRDVPRLRRRNARRFELDVIEVSVWRCK